MRLVGPPQPVPSAPDLVRALARAAAHPSGVTFVGLDEREQVLGWAEVHGRAARVAAALDALGIRPGDRVAIVLRTEPAFLDAFFGVLLCGAVPVPLYPPVRLGRMEEYLAATARMVRLSGARLILAGGAVRRLIGEVVAQARPELGCQEVEGLERGRRALERAVDPGALALVQFSSGSTVDPKPVALTHAAVVAQTASILEVLRPGPEGKLVSWLPLYHDMGLIGGLLSALAYPGPAVLLAPEHFLARPALWLRALARQRGTVSVAPSFAYAYAAQRVKDADLAGCDLSAWRAALDGAEPVAPAALRRFAERFAPFGFDPAALMPVYGLSEAALAVTFTPPGRGWRSRTVDPAALAGRGEVAPGRREVVSVGTPVPGVEVEVRGPGGEALPELRLGRIFARGPSIMAGYLGQPEATARALQAGWLDTGDLGFVDQGELFVHGREKDVVIVRGANHAPDELELPLLGVPGVRPGCVVAVGVEEGEDGEELLVLAERAGPARDDARVAEAARQAVLAHAGVRAREVVMLAPGALPRTSSGKMRRAEALRRHLAGTLAPPAPVTALRLLRQLARSTLAHVRARRAPPGAAPGHPTAGSQEQAREPARRPGRGRPVPAREGGGSPE